MDLQLAGKVAIVTGASKGIGRAIAETLAGEGMKLVLAARSRDLLETLAGSLTTECLVQAVDLRDPAEPARLVQAAVQRFGGVDLLVNNAGATRRGDFLTLSDEDWQDGFALKFFGAMRLSRAAWPQLQKSSGSIVSIIGVGGRTGQAEFAIGGSVNAAAMNLTKVLADRGVADGVRVNAINPGTIATERLQVRIRSFAAEHGISEAEAAERMPRAMGVARFGEPAEIARAVAFLASPQAAYLNGAIIDVDGGLTRTL
ncbi:MAG TPA: SDR family oxidoreductase [Ferrovibrio sp.]|jgi:NAD(P)-dependent dehydrogenase (short-subunit alcohol dehydrogenase family)|uniref:SDR family oxidoreductase n=1 Tax=Ferrovibrio sp. TaxID=1917215 RepID=UPI002B4AC975|nr:SDR family oxidoreductase [Ferrovibrio sp.]HLT76933.1 SDR family oxidoreductase [Ferrovibrio sp.]